MRRDALARIASAALWRGRGDAWDDVREIAFLFEDFGVLRIRPRFVASCPVPSEYHLVQVIGRALERGGALGIERLHGESNTHYRHIDRIVAEYAAESRTAVVLLHESYSVTLDLQGTAAEELPPSDADENRTIVFFLGAVKDMTQEEMRDVARACRMHRVPFIEASLGQQAEFTSKVIDVLQGHHIYRRLMPAVWACVERSVTGKDIPAQQAVQRSARGTFWVIVPVGGGPRDLAADDQKRDGIYEVPRCLISQLWCSRNEHSNHVISFVFASGEVITAYPTLVTCLKLQHRAAPTERNLVSALRVGFGDQRADPSLVIDKGCVTLRKDASDLVEDQVVTGMIDGSRTAIVDLQIGMPLASSSSFSSLRDSETEAVQEGIRDVVVLVRQASSRDFPKGFREKLAATIHPASRAGGSEKAQKKTSRSELVQFSLPKISVNAAISLLAYYWQAGALIPALLSGGDS
jgi:hypothetical protein